MKKDISVGEIVALDFRAASVFKQAGIDFCCGGKKTIDETCMEKGLNKSDLLDRLLQLESQPLGNTLNFNEWEPVFLCDYIRNTHHKYVLKTMPDLLQYTSKLALVHGAVHPELIEVEHLFSAINRELLQHMKKEEEVLFPAIRNYINTRSDEAKEIIADEIARLSEEHEFAGGAMDKINVITDHYKVPSDGCNTYKVGFKLLEEFEDDLHVHVHLENNVLFPKLKF